jgi:hypothetical protein
MIAGFQLSLAETACKSFGKTNYLKLVIYLKIYRLNGFKGAF